MFTLVYLERLELDALFDTLTSTPKLIDAI